MNFWVIKYFRKIHLDTPLLSVFKTNDKETTVTLVDVSAIYINSEHLLVSLAIR